MAKPARGQSSGPPGVPPTMTTTGSGGCGEAKKAGGRYSVPWRALKPERVPGMSSGARTPCMVGSGSTVVVVSCGTDERWSPAVRAGRAGDVGEPLLAAARRAEPRLDSPVGDAEAPVVLPARWPGVVPLRWTGEVGKEAVASVRKAVMAATVAGPGSPATRSARAAALML